MKPVVTDIDIDTPDRNAILALFPHVRAANHANGDIRQHNTGVYFHDIPIDPYTNCASIDYKEAEELGYFKIDILNVGMYKDISDSAHMDMLLNKEPIWQLLEEEDFCNLVFHMRNHHDICKQMKPTSIKQLAAVLAIIRPAKRHLAGKSWDHIFKTVWENPNDGSYYFKHSHSIAYAAAVVLHMNLVVEKLGY